MLLNTTGLNVNPKKIIKIYNSNMKNYKFIKLNHSKIENMYEKNSQLCLQHNKL